MSIDKIPRFDARIDGETVFLKDSPTGPLVNSTMLLSALQRRRAELMKQVDTHRDVIIKQQIKGSVWTLEDIIRALGEEPL